MKQDNKSPLLLLLLLLGAFGFLYLSMDSEEQDEKELQAKEKITATSPKAAVLINKHLWETNIKKEHAERKIEADNAYTNPRVGESLWPEGKENNHFQGVDHSPDRNEDSVYQDLNRDRKEYRNSNPDHIIQGQIQDAQKMKAYEEAYRKEYARQFIENARRHGWEVTLDSNFVVTKVKPIRPDQSRNPSFDLGSSRRQAQ